MIIQKIACCTDFSENADAAVKMAMEMAQKYNASLTILHVLPPPVKPLLYDAEWTMPETPQDGLINKLESRMHEKYVAPVSGPVDTKIVVLSGHVSSEIIRYLDENKIDLVVVGSYGLTGMELVFFGSVANRITHKAPCSVLIARKP